MELKADIVVNEYKEELSRANHENILLKAQITQTEKEYKEKINELENQVSQLKALDGIE